MTDEVGVWERFWDKVRTGATKECWPWTASKLPNGYGQFWLHSRIDKAHRVVYELSRGPIPSGLWILHTCDNRGCVNPAHLYAGTHKDNMRDMVIRGRSNTGEKNQRHKLSSVEVAEIRKLRSWGMVQRDIAEHFGVAQTTVSKIATGLRWGSAA